MNTDNIKFVVTDVDGTLTDGGMYITSAGEHFKRFDTRDGIAVSLLHTNSYHVGIISNSKVTGMVTERAKMLDIKHCYVGTENKLDVLKDWIKELNITFDQVAYLGDDINDKEVMEAVGLAICPNDANRSIKAISDIMLKSNGGQGCLREFIEEHLGLSE
ncbi:MAG: 3-deoxy-D-manno-octulosonate 8-phosphate phosphatase [Bacteroidetes bacterium]|nr:HAD-IIIA family hydrolase [Bacteroidia bacterium]PCH68203.1 MAG: 3-deoxy-D-manno-octulosonate 8-phosphate phosphatase [Bacteroidota bacterium]